MARVFPGIFQCPWGAKSPPVVVLGFVRPDLHYFVFTGAARENWFSGIKFTGDDNSEFHFIVQREIFLLLMLDSLLLSEIPLPGIKTIEDQIGNKQIAWQSWKWNTELLERYFIHAMVSDEIPIL